MSTQPPAQTTEEPEKGSYERLCMLADKIKEKYTSYDVKIIKFPVSQSVHLSISVKPSEPKPQEEQPHDQTQ